MLPNRASDQPAPVLSRIRAYKDTHTHTHAHTEWSSPQDPVSVIQVRLCLLLYPPPAVQDCRACCEFDAQGAAALANSRDWLCERLSCHLGGPV